MDKISNFLITDKIRNLDTVKTDVIHKFLVLLSYFKQPLRKYTEIESYEKFDAVVYTDYKSAIEDRLDDKSKVQLLHTALRNLNRGEYNHILNELRHIL